MDDPRMCLKVFWVTLIHSNQKELQEEKHLRVG